MDAVNANELGLKAFARLLGFKPSYATQLKNEGRLVLTADGKRVVVDESRALIEDTRDPAKAAVARRHALQRAVGANGDSAAPNSSTSMELEGAGSESAEAAEMVRYSDPVEASHARRKSKAQADKAETDAKAAERDYRTSMGELLSAVEVEQSLQMAAATLRNALENLPNILAPELAAATDEARCRVLMQEAIEHALGDVSRRFAAIGKMPA